MHSNLNFHHAEAGALRVDDISRIKELAHAALKHVPGGTQAVEKQFNRALSTPEIKEPKIVNLHYYHTPHR